MTNMLNRISEKASTTVKKQAKNITLASALIATLASCGNKAENTTQNQIDTTKVEKVEKIDLINNETNTKNSQNVEDTLSIEGDADAILAASEAEGISEEISEKKQEAREVAGISKEDREYFEKVYTLFDKDLAESLKIEDYIRDNEEYLKKTGEMIEVYIDATMVLNKPISPKAQKAIDKYNAHKKKKKNN